MRLVKEAVVYAKKPSLSLDEIGHALLEHRMARELEELSADDKAAFSVASAAVAYLGGPGYSDEKRWGRDKATASALSRAWMTMRGVDDDARKARIKAFAREVEFALAEPGIVNVGRWLRDRATDIGIPNAEKAKPREIELALTKPREGRRDASRLPVSAVTAEIVALFGLRIDAKGVNEALRPPRSRKR